MRADAARIIPMGPAHVAACEAIAAGSEPWRRLGEKVDFPRYMAAKEAFVCLVRNETAGFVIFSREPVFARGGYLRAIGVAAAARKRGVGSLLLAFAEKTTARHAAHFYLCVSSFNRIAQAFYRNRGYARIGKIPGLIIPEASEYIYWKQLRPRRTNLRTKGPQ